MPFAGSNWNASGQNTREFGGQKIAYAPSTTPGARDAALDTVRLTTTANLLPAGSDPPVYPQMSGADVNVPAIQQVAGKSGSVSTKLAAAPLLTCMRTSPFASISGRSTSPLMPGVNSYSSSGGNAT